MATSYNTYRLGVVASLKFLAIENMPPHISAYVCYGQRTEWIRIPLGTEVGLGPGDIVRWGPSSPTRKEAQQPSTFQPTALARIPAGPHFTHNPYCRLGSARRAALVAILRINATRVVYFCC